MDERRILMGVIGRPHGVRGLLHVHSYATEDLAGYAPLLDEQGRKWSLVWRGEGVAEVRDAAGQPVADRTAAERLVNTKLFVDRVQLPVPGDDDFYLSDLVGMAAVDGGGATLGRVVQVHDYGAGASLEIVGDGKALLVPFTKLAVPEVDLAAGRVTVMPPDEIEIAETPSPKPSPGGRGLQEGAEP